MKSIVSYPFFLILFLFLYTHSYAQIGINTNGKSPDPSAMLDILSTEKGFLMPRMQESERQMIPNPANGLAVYQTDGTTGIYINEGDPITPQWTLVGNAADSSTVNCETRIPIDSVPFVINAPGSYYLTRDLVNTVPNAIAIAVTLGNVTIDLNGYTLSSGSASPSRGIDIFTGINFTIKNGVIEGFTVGIDAPSIDFGTIRDVTVSNSTFNGVQVDDYWNLDNCVSFNNGDKGILTGDFCILDKCNSTNNFGNGIESGFQGLVKNCISRGNLKTGFRTLAGTLLTQCVSGNNVEYGFYLAGDVSIYHSTANFNSFTGFYLLNGGIIESCESNSNGSAGLFIEQQSGIRVGEKAVIRNNHVYDNTANGIMTFSVDNKIEGNTAVTNGRYGIFVSLQGNLTIKNQASGNTLGNYSLNASSSFGPIIDISAGGDISTISGANHPMANFEY